MIRMRRNWDSTSIEIQTLGLNIRAGVFGRERVLDWPLFSYGGPKDWNAPGRQIRIGRLAIGYRRTA